MEYIFPHAKEENLPICFIEKAINENMDSVSNYINHPFNAEMIFGTLDADSFQKYLEQELLYMPGYTKLIDSILPLFTDPEEKKFFSRYCSDNCEGELIYMKETADYCSMTLRDNGLDPACKDYLDFLYSIAETKSILYILASLAPCNFLYLFNGRLKIKAAELNDSCYYNFILRYASVELEDDLKVWTKYLDEHYLKASLQEQKRCIQIFGESVEKEIELMSSCLSKDIKHYTYDYADENSN